MDELEAILETGGAAAIELAASAVLDHGGKTMPCPNCGKPMIGPFCALCGQPLNTHRRSLGHLVQEFVKDIASFDSRILRTAKALLVQPGELPKAFREGRTQRYVPAVRLYFFVSLLFFLFLSATGIAFIQFSLNVTTIRYTHDAAGRVYKVVNGKATLVEDHTAKGKVARDDRKPGINIQITGDDAKDTTNYVYTQMHFFRRLGQVHTQLTPQIKATLDELKKAAAEQDGASSSIFGGMYRALVRMQTDPGSLNEPMLTWIPRILFVLVPLFAALLALFYRVLRKSYLFVDHLVLSLNLHSFAFVVLIGGAILGQMLPEHWVAALIAIVLSIYFLLSLKAFYNQNWLKTGLKFIGITVIYAVFFLGPALAFVVAASVFQSP